MNVQSHYTDVSTPTGLMRTYIHRPTDNKAYPTILFYSEIFQQTGPIERAARFLAGQGYSVLVPEVFHELNPIGTVLGYDETGRVKGNQDKASKPAEHYDSDNVALLIYAQQQAWCNGQFGAMGFCVGGHLAFRAALQAKIKAAVCCYATDLQEGGLIPSSPEQRSLARLASIQGELLMIWGRQDPYIPALERADIYRQLDTSGVRFTWHEFNAQHAFMRDEDARYDAAASLMSYQLALSLFRRVLI